MYTNVHAFIQYTQILHFTGNLNTVPHLQYQVSPQQAKKLKAVCDKNSKCDHVTQTCRGAKTKRSDFLILYKMKSGCKSNIV